MCMEIKTYKRPSANVVCLCCGVLFEKELCEIERAKRNGYNHFCSMSCASKYGVHKRYGESIGFAFYATACRKRAKINNLPFNLTPIFLKRLWDSQDGMCAITGIPMEMNRTRSGKSLKSIYYGSVDRIDSNAGYIEDNVQFVTLGVNYMKNNFDTNMVKEFINNIRRVK